MGIASETKQHNVNMAQQTAVEWIAKELEDYGNPQVCEINWEVLDALINQARKIEKEQIEKAYEQGTLDGYEPNYGSGEQYYNETFGKS